MHKTILRLPDGRELSSGSIGHSAVCGITLTQCVNAGTELTIGSVCAGLLECSLLCPAEESPVQAGDEIALYRETERGERQFLGLFTAEKPNRVSRNKLKFVAYDRVSRLDQDVSRWLQELEGWPYSLWELAQMVCDRCRVPLRETVLPNGGLPVAPLTGEGITGRRLLQWIGQCTGRFCRANEAGELEFAWYAPSQVRITDQTVTEATASFQDTQLALEGTGLGLCFDRQGNVALEGEALSAQEQAENVTLTLPDAGERICCLSGSLQYSDYLVAPVTQVRICQSSQDVGTVWPETAGENPNCYVLSDNPILTAMDTANRKAVLKALYEQLCTVCYTPCQVSVPAGTAVRAGEIVTVEAAGGSFPVYVMSRVQSGQRDTVKCTGSRRRDSTAAVNQVSVQSLNGKVLNLRTEVDGIQAENRDLAGKMASLRLNVDGITATVESQKENMGVLRQEVTRLEQDATGLKLSVEKVRTDGASQVRTEKGFTFDDQGLRIRQTGSEMENRLDEQGMYVTRFGQTILQADSNGVTARDVTVRNYLIAGGHARLEEYETNRTACFWI